MYETPVKCRRRVLAGLLALALLPLSARADETEGRWDGPFCWPVVGTHMIHLHTGKIMIWPGHYTESDEIEVWLWEPKPGCFGDNPRDNPDGNCFTRADNDETNLFCAGHAALADGTILATGGHTGGTKGRLQRRQLRRVHGPVRRHIGSLMPGVGSGDGG